MSSCSPVHRQADRPRTALWLALALWLLALLPGPAAAGPTCHGRFMNPITDICWSCLFPLTIGSASILSDGQPDISNPSSPVCYCSNPHALVVEQRQTEPLGAFDARAMRELYKAAPTDPKGLRRTIRRSELRQIVPLADSTIHELERRGDFPRRFYLTRHAAWYGIWPKSWPGSTRDGSS